MMKPVNLNPLLLMALIAVVAVALTSDWPAHGEPKGKQTAAFNGAAAPTGRPESSRKIPLPDSGWIGIMLEQKDNTLPTVVEVFPGGPAAFAGIRKGDQISKVAGRPVKTVASVASAIEKSKPGQPIEVIVVRGEKEVPLTAHVGSLRRFHLRYMAEMMRRDPRDPDFGKRPGVSPADMQIEVTRRLFEQNERIERSLHQVLVELNALRKQVAELKKK